jgi:hypothetical protein
LSAGIKANVDGSAAIQVGGTDVITLTSGGAATFVTSPTTVQAGTAAAPSITTSGDTNTGIFFPAADTIAFAEGGVESMRLNSSGNVGIGTTSPVSRLAVNLANTAFSPSQAPGIGGGNNTRVQFTAAEPGVMLSTDINGSGTQTGSPTVSMGMQIGLYNTNDIRNQIWWSGGYPLTFTYSGTPGASPTERARIDSSGNFLVGTTSSTGGGGSSGKIVVQFNGAATNGIFYDDTRTSAGTDNAAIFCRGTTAVGRLDTTLTSLALTNLSDQRVKINIEDAESAIDILGAVKVRKFDWTIDNSHEDFGFVAQELNEVLPQAVSVGKTEEEMWGVNFVKLIPILTKATQEQQAMIDELKAKVAALEGA